MNPRATGLFAAIIAVAAFLANKNVDWHPSVTTGRSLPPLAQLIVFTLVLSFWPLIIAAGLMFRKKRPTAEKAERISVKEAAKGLGLISLWASVTALGLAWELFVLLGVFGLLLLGVKVLFG